MSLTISEVFWTAYTMFYEYVMGYKAIETGDYLDIF